MGWVSYAAEVHGGAQMSGRELLVLVAFRTAQWAGHGAPNGGYHGT